MFANTDCSDLFRDLDDKEIEGEHRMICISTSVSVSLDSDAYGLIVTLVDGQSR